MSIKRVQKLLFSEYCDFEDMVLIESPFAQTTREGRGLRQVHLGLTPSKLVLATDVLPPVEASCISFLPGLDPDIETFELIAIYPIDCVNLSVFRKRKRQTIKAHFCNNRVFYFELGGFQNRNMFWNLWCEKVKFLSPESGSSHSESSIATSSSSSTLYLVNKKQILKPNGLTQVWCKYGTGKDESAIVAPKWTERYIYLGKNYDDVSNYQPIMHSPRISQFIYPKHSNLSKRRFQQIEKPEVTIGDWYPINRFGSGIKEGCKSALFLPAENYIVPKRWSQTSHLSSDTDEELQMYTQSGPVDMAEDCVRRWEVPTSMSRRMRHRRRYGFVPQPLFLYGLGPWNISPGTKYSIQVKRAVSVVTIRRQPVESELRLPITKRQLVTTISCDTLHQDNVKINNQTGCGGPRKPVVIFWTPNYWYRPRSAKDAYQELKQHLAKISEYHRKNKRRRRLFRRWVPRPDSSDTDSSSTPTHLPNTNKRKSMIRFSVFGGKSSDICDVEGEKSSKESSLHYLKRILRVDVVLTAWDFNSTTLAQQLTMIDRDLFLKISTIELSILVSQQCSKNAPNVAAMVAFAHRISCLVASDILKNKCERMRARLVSRFITVAEKCHRISNFHSCRTVLLGLQSPAIYRLRVTWAYVRKKHGSKYQTFELLCKLYRDPRLLNYQKAFYLSSGSTPYMPFIGDVIAKLLDRIPEYKLGSATKSKHRIAVVRENGVLAKLLASVKLTNFRDESVSEGRVGEARKGLCDYYKPGSGCANGKMKCLIETTEFLQQCQLSALHYSFMGNILATDYLLKARYKEEKDNFYVSLNLECIEDN